MVVYRISLAPEHKHVGLGRIFGWGFAAFTETDNEFLVTERALRVLDVNKIPYQVVSGTKEQDPQRAAAYER